MSSSNKQDAPGRGAAPSRHPTASLAAVVFVLFLVASPARGRPPGLLEMFADITTDTVTEFGTYRPHLVNIIAVADMYTIAPDFSNVVNFGNFTFTNEQKSLLLQNGFVVVPQAFGNHPPRPFAEMYDVYNYARENELPIFVSVDALLHAYHELYDYALRTIEAKRFLGDLENLTTAMVTASRAQFDAAADPKVQDAALRNVAYFTVAAQLLSSSTAVATDVAASVSAELALIDAHAGLAASPIFGYSEDYSQYIPRGHYTLSADLKRYFRAMMWYGRMAFHAEPVGWSGVTLEMAREETRRALLVTQLMDTVAVSTETAQAVWERIYVPTTFFVGKADDLTFHQYAQIARTIYGTDLGAVAVDDFADEAKLTQVLDAVQALPPPSIATDEWGKGFRFMGQRFIPDSYMLEQLVFPYVGGRQIPRGLDVMAVLGSERAYLILDTVYHEAGNPDYVSQIADLRAEFQALDDSVWAQNLYWNWLYCLMPMLAPKGFGFPTFMQNDAWTDKELSCALGSWAELRHDTILYAKQSATVGLGSQGFRDAFVEPNPWAFARLAALTRLMIDGLSDLGLLLDEFGERLENLEDLLLSLEQIAEKELTNEPITIVECKLIRTIGKRLAYLTIFDRWGDIIVDDDMAVIADVHTDFTSGKCLEVGVGRPLTLYVVNGSGDQLVIALGSAFAYYEFLQPLSDRLTDEKWREMLSGASPPALPEWMASYIDFTAAFDLGQPVNAHDGISWGSRMTIDVTPLATGPAAYTVHVTVNDCEYSSLSLEVVCGTHRKTITLSRCSGPGGSNAEFEGILDLQGWPEGTVTVTAYALQNIDVIETDTFYHTDRTAIRPHLWQLY